MKMIALAALALVASCTATPRPSHPAGYRVPASVGSLVVDGAAFTAFVAEVRPDLERGAASPDREVRKARLFVLAMLDGLDEKWPAAIARLDQVAALEPTPEAKAMTGLTLRVWADANGDRARFRAALDARVAALPRDKLAKELAMLRTMGQVFTPDVCRQLVDEAVGPHVVNGTVGIEDVHAIVFQRYAVVRLVPVGIEIDAALGALGVPSLQN